MADFVYEKLRAGTTQNDSDSGSEVARKFNDNFEKVAEKFTEISEKIGKWFKYFSEWYYSASQ